jgi:hypothetical protein
MMYLQSRVILDLLEWGLSDCKQQNRQECSLVSIAEAPCHCELGDAEAFD